MTYSRLLDVLSPKLYEILEPRLEPVRLHHGKVLCFPGDVIQELYFPIDCLLSITITMENGDTAETGVIGNRDVLGINAIMGGRETTQTEYVVQIEGDATKIDAQFFREVFDSNVELRSVLLSYTQAFIAQLSQTTACNSLHRLEQRFGRWLLEAHDRVESDDILLSQRYLAQMLGVRRAGVTQAAQKLQDQGLIAYERKKIRICDRDGLEAVACECFGKVRQEYDRLLGHKHNRRHRRE